MSTADTSTLPADELKVQRRSEIALMEKGVKDLARKQETLLRRVRGK